jgi:NADPH-dependent glutamate synthase beta subunit-like oxidoreductase/NAD-dependent dihydropyrimidine dehydrogenase PreA subunit
MEKKGKVLELANKISRVKMGSKQGIRYEHPEYEILEPIVTNEMAEIALFLKFREPQTAKDVAKVSGKTFEEVDRTLKDLSQKGVCIVNEIDGVDHYWFELWVPGHFELLVNNRELVAEFPQIALAFEKYGRRKGPAAAGLFPIGTGPMRVIPIESAISDNSHHASYEEVSMYLNDNEIFSVSDCSCRTAREIAGEGCGHLKEDMCIQMGNAAKYYIKTGKGREITREEAFEIIKRAEENGLMHTIPNVDGPGHTHAICNCCGCSCFALRNASMFLNNDFVRSNYVAEVDPKKCVACGECVEVCPTNAAKLGQKICSTKPIHIPETTETPADTEWGPERFNEDYRINRKNVVDSGTSPCKTNCPAHISVQGYIKLAAQGKYREALELIKHENPFPAVCGRICPRKCEDACTRGEIDDPVAVDEIKRFIAEQDLNAEYRYVPKKRHAYGKKIAVIGAGPSGLACAYYLAVDGYDVTVFEKQQVLGGMLTLGIPNYRLEKNIINAEIEILRELGVTFKTGVDVGSDVTLKELRKEGYKAFYVAIGAQGGRKLGLAGEDAKGVMSGVDFLKEVNLGNKVKIEGKVIVIGGGNVAIDVARTAIRAGDTKVSMYCLENREQMPAHEEEIQEALSEDVEINCAWSPSKILVEQGKVVGMEFKKCISVWNEEGAFAPVFDEKEIKTVEADHVLVAIGQSIEWGELLEESKVVLKRNNTAEIDTFTLQTEEPDIFVGGDAATGPRFAIDAIALGKEGAISIHRFVQPGQSLIIGRDRREYVAFDKSSLLIESYDNTGRQATESVDGLMAKTSFQDFRKTFTETQVKKETERCLGCGATVVDPYVCVGCGACTTKCKFDAISLVRKYDKTSVPIEKLKKTVMKNMVKRQGKITIKKISKSLKGKN